MVDSKVELLAPAGSPESFYAAINAGADAIYFAGSRFGARAYAANFSEEEVIAAISHAHLFGVRVYMTVNTLLKDFELKELYSYILPYYEAGLDGVIIQDMGVFHFLKNHFPDLELHMSTQVSLCTPFGAELMKEQGACRIVPAREISLEEIKAIKANVDIQIESFIHGAMCYCYSGQCLFSSILGGRSGNRGRCAQPCRLPYSAKTEKGTTEGHLLSLKDMCTIYQLPDLIEAGIDSFKIEGRMKRPEYVAGVCSIYRKYIDKYYQLREQYGAEKAKEKFKISQEDSKTLNSLYIRSEIQNGYYYKHNGREMITIDSPAYTETSDTVLTSIREKYLTQNKKLPVSVYGYFEAGSPATVTMTWNDISVSAEGNVVDIASKSPVTEENVMKQLSKMGDTVFAVDSIYCQVGDNAFYPLKAMNELRREACAKLEDQLLLNSKQDRHATTLSEDNIKQNKTQIKSGIKVSVYTFEQLQALIDWQNTNPDITFHTLWIDSDCYLKNKTQINEILQVHANAAELLGLSMPYVLRERDQAYLTELQKQFKNGTLFSAVLVRSMDSYAFVKKYLSDVSVFLDAGVYIWNTEAKRFYDNEVSGFTIPYELKAGEQRHLPLSEASFDKVIYSRIPMMITANCVRKTTSGCNSNSEKAVILKDRYGKEFPAVTVCSHCYNIIYNSLPFSLHKEIAKWENTVSFRLDFTIENKVEIMRILDFFMIRRGAGDAPFEYTTGHEKRGVE